MESLCRRNTYTLQASQTNDWAFTVQFVTGIFKRRLVVIFLCYHGKRIYNLENAAYILLVIFVTYNLYARVLPLIIDFNYF